jgi:sigma-B regulation protein RsbU (phosphoserine phosphatase)
MRPDWPHHPIISLTGLADALFGVESSQDLVDHLHAVLVAAKALPARLYLYAADQGLFYPAAGFGCETGCEEIAAPIAGAELPPGAHLLSSGGSWVGILALLGDGPYERSIVEELCQLLGPALLMVHRRIAMADDLRQVKAEAAQLINAGHLLHHLDIEILLVRILEMVMGSVRAQVGAVLTADEHGRLNLNVSLGLTEKHIRAIRDRDGRQITDVVLGTGQAICLDGPAIRTQLDVSGLEAQLDGLLVLPIASRDRMQGVVMLANPEVDFSESQKRIALTVCGMAAIALNNALLVRNTLDQERLKREMTLAHEVQRQMYPEHGIKIGRLRAEGSSRPCDETGGDYFSFLTRNDQLVAMIGDVSGHGLGAALYTTMAHAIIQQQIRAGARIEPATLVLNEALYHTQSGRFMTFALVQIEPATLAFSYVSAGHNPLLWLHHGEPRWLDSCGMPLGIVPDEAFPLQSGGVLAPGDYLILYTDGFTEAVDSRGEVYGEARLAAVAQRGWRQAVGPSEMMAQVIAEVEAWLGGERHLDDLTLVVIAVGG